MDLIKLKCQLVLVLLYSSKLEAASIGLVPEGIQCACIGDRLIYKCTVVGGGTTVWSGTVFDCPLDGSEITLRHSQYTSNQAFGFCNDGDISGRGIDVTDNCYTSQLNLTVRESFNNKTVQCILNSNEGIRTVGESLLSIVSATNRYPSPANIYLTDAQPGTLVFNWTPVITNCSTLQYSITSDCGTCPTITNSTTAICSDFQLTTNANLCNFRVSSRACDLTGNPSSPIVVTLKVPNIPQFEIVPSYSYDRQALERLFIIMNQTVQDQFYISGNISGSPINYLAYGSNSISGASFSSTVSVSDYEEGSGYPIELPPSYCSQSAIINITISAANKLGEGPTSNPFMIECINNFVQVMYSEMTSESLATITCVFLNPSDTSKKSCCITHQICDLTGPENSQVCKGDSPYNIQVEESGNSRHCYTVTARNGTYTIRVDVTFTSRNDNFGGSTNTHTAAAIAGGVVLFILILSLTLLLLGAILFNTVRKKCEQPQQCGDKSTNAVSPFSDIHPPNLSKQHLPPYDLPNTFILHEVDRDCSLQEFITETLCVEFKRGHAYYEFTNKVENIQKGKAVLLQDIKNTKKWFQLENGRLNLYGVGIARSSFGDQYRVFIQSFGSGARYLPKGSSILCNHSADQVEPDVLPLVPICSEHFAHKIIDSEEGCTVQQFCAQNGLSQKAYNVFLTVEHLPEGMRAQPPRDVILMDRDSRELFTGPDARQMLDPNKQRESQHENNKWKVFVLLEKKKQDLILQKNSEVLYQDLNYHEGNFAVLDVDIDCVRLSKFIEMKLNCQYEDGKAFYEVVENENETEIEEDLLYYKKILRPRKNELDCARDEIKLQSLIEYFYEIHGVPSKAVKPEQLRLKGHKIFIQSTSQGSRCLKKGEKILYLKEYCGTPAGDHPNLVTDSAV